MKTHRKGGLPPVKGGGAERLERVEKTLSAEVAITTVGISRAVNLRFPALSSSAQGKSVPKARPKGVVDGNPVKTPEPLTIV